MLCWRTSRLGRLSPFRYVTSMSVARRGRSFRPARLTRWRWSRGPHRHPGIATQAAPAPAAGERAGRRYVPGEPADHLRRFGALSKQAGNPARDPETQGFRMCPRALSWRDHSETPLLCQGVRASFIRPETHPSRRHRPHPHGQHGPRCAASPLCLGSLSRLQPGTDPSRQNNFACSSKLPSSCQLLSRPTPNLNVRSATELLRVSHCTLTHRSLVDKVTSTHTSNSRLVAVQSCNR